MGFLFAEAHQDDVCGQAVQPGGEGGFAAEGVNFAEELKEGFLREVFGLEGVADHAEAEAVDAARVLAVEDSKAAASPRCARRMVASSCAWTV